MLYSGVKPIFVSIGNNIDLDTAVEFTMRTVGKEGHISVPTRLADMDTHYWRKSYKSIYVKEHVNI